MPLQSVNLAPRDDGFAVSFVMLDGARAIRCYAQQGTLDAIEQSRTDDAASVSSGSTGIVPHSSRWRAISSTPVCRSASRPTI